MVSWDTMTRFATIQADILDKWHKATESIEIPKEALNPKAKIIKDSSGNSKYTFGAILNSYRFQRDTQSDDDRCPLCGVLNEIEKNPVRNLFPDSKLDYIVTPNRFPIMVGASLAIAKGTKEKERPVYTTRNLSKLSEEISELFSFADSTGFQIFHNSDGAGASIPHHEHWHFVNFGESFNLVGGKYGFEHAEYDDSKKNNKIQIMPDFPFAHLIFNQNDPERITSFLHNLGLKLGDTFPKGSVPHVICQNSPKVLVVPYKKHIMKGLGSADIAGHLIFRSEEEFNQADYNYCMNKLQEILFTKREISLESII